MKKDEENFLNAHLGRSAGALLKEAREERQVSIEEIEETLKIKARHIQAIENDEYEDLPPRVYAIGFVKSYAEYMGFDPDQMVKLFKMKTIGHHADNVDLSSHGELMAVSQTPSRFIIIVSVLVLCALGVFVGKRNTQDMSAQNKEEQIVPPVPKSLTKTLEETPIMTFKDTDIKALRDPPKKEEAKKEDLLPSLEEKSAHITIRAIYDSWIEVRGKDNKPVYSGILQMGRRYEVPAGGRYRLMTGNAGGTEILLGETSLGVLGRISQVRKNIDLDEDTLRSRLKEN